MQKHDTMLLLVVKINMSSPEFPKPPQTVQEYGFVSHTNGDPFLPADQNLIPEYRGKVTEPLATELLETDQGNQIMLTSLVGAHKGLRDIANDIEEKGQRQHSDQIQGYVLGMLKSIADDNGRGVKTITGTKETIYYSGNTGVSNGRLLRVYLTKIGENGGVPVYGKIAACRTKNHEDRVYKLLGIDGKIKL
jgi:hypothetical protein